MTGDTVDCFNCGRPNPGWAQVCRSCGVPLVAAGGSTAPSGPFPTDQASLLSMGAAIGAVLVVILAGFLLSSASPTTPTVGFSSASPTPHESISIRPSRSAAPSTPVVVETPAPTPVPSVVLPGTLTFGTGLDANRAVTGVTNEFTSGSPAFAHSIAFAEAYGADTVSEEVSRIAGDGTETVVQTREEGTFQVEAGATTLSYSAPIAGLYSAWGPGTYIMRIYRGTELVAQRSFVLQG